MTPYRQNLFLRYIYLVQKGDKRDSACSVTNWILKCPSITLLPGGGYPQSFLWGVQPEHWNPCPILDQNLWFSIPCFRSDPKVKAPFQTSKITVEPPVTTTSCKQPPLLSDQFFQNTKSFLVQSLYLEPLVSDNLLLTTATTYRAKSLKLSFVLNLP